MTTEVKKPEKKVETKKSIWTSDEVNKLGEVYGTDIIVENGTLEEITTTQAPNDAYIIKYVYEDSVRCDLTRGTKTNLFDMYWDKLKNDLKSIDYGKGTIKPNLWGYKAPAPKKKRKG